MMTRRQIHRALAGLEALEAFGRELERGGSDAPAVAHGVIELVEVSPGVFAAPSRPVRAANPTPSFAARMRAALSEADAIGARVRELRRKAEQWK